MASGCLEGYRGLIDKNKQAFFQSPWKSMLHISRTDMTPKRQKKDETWPCNFLRKRTINMNNQEQVSCPVYDVISHCSILAFAPVPCAGRSLFFVLTTPKIGHKVRILCSTMYNRHSNHMTPHSEWPASFFVFICPRLVRFRPRDCSSKAGQRGM